MYTGCQQNRTSRSIKTVHPNVYAKFVGLQNKHADSRVVLS